MTYQAPMARVPFFFFADREHGIDAEQSAVQGYEVPKVVTFICITPHGHKGDPMEFIADEFVSRKHLESRAGRYDPEWVKEYKAGLELYREGRTIPRHGTPLITWERILKSRRETLQKRFPTLEDLAATPDSSLSEIGMDGRVLRDLARGDVQAKESLAPVVKQLADANESNRQLQERLEQLTARLSVLEAADEPRRGPGRPRKIEEAA